MEDTDETSAQRAPDSRASARRSFVRHITDKIPLHRRSLQPAGGADQATNGGPLGAFGRYNRAYFQRWLVIGALIGVVAGVGAIVFYSAISICTRIFLGLGAGFYPPGPAGEGATVIQPIARPWMIPIITTLGGLLTGLIVFTLAPEAEGHGTDAAIEAFHEKNGKIRSRIPPIKLVASAITIGSGGSAGREGPTAQIAAGFGSWLGDLLHLDDHDRRIAMAAGVGAGIGSIFKAPFGGALLSGEILYKRDFEAEALFPAFIASVVGFSIYGAWAGWTPVFGPGGHFSFTDPESLIGFLILGIVCGLTGLLYPKTLYGLRDQFHKLRIPNQLKPAIGGLLVGLIGFAFPQALGMGYGYVQFGVNGDFLTISAWLMLALVFVKILTTSLTIGSGGSGGVFGPGMVIGGFLGGALWAGLHTWAPWMLGQTPPGAFVVVGMGAFFGGIAKAPLAVILMVAEMTGEYSLIVPAMLATMVAYLMTGDSSIYESQVDTRLDSPAHKDDYVLPLLQSLSVSDAMVSGLAGALATATPDTPLEDVSALIRDRHVASVPIIQDGRLVGIVTAVDLARIPPEDVPVSRVRQVMSRGVARAFPDESLYAAWLRMSRRGLRQLAVVDRAEPARLLGMVTADGIGQFLRPPTRRTALPGASGEQRIPQPAATAAPVESPVPVRPTADVEADEDEEDTEVPDHELVAARSGAEILDSVATRAQREEPSGGAAPTGAGAGAAAQGAGVDPLMFIRVAEAMLTTPRLVHETEPVASARQMLDDRGSALMVVDDAGRLVGIVTRSDLRARADHEAARELKVSDIAVRNLVVAHPNETLRVAVRRMSRLGLRQLPVVEGDLPAPPLGLLRRSDILAAYERSLGPAIPTTVLNQNHTAS